MMSWKEKMRKKRTVKKPVRFLSESSDEEDQSAGSKRLNEYTSLSESTKAKLPDPERSNLQEKNMRLFGEDDSCEDGGGSTPQNVRSAPNNELRAKSSNAKVSPAQTANTKRPEGEERFLRLFFLDMQSYIIYIFLLQLAVHFCS